MVNILKGIELECPICASIFELDVEKIESKKNFYLCQCGQRLEYSFEIKDSLSNNVGEKNKSE